MPLSMLNRMTERYCQVKLKWDDRPQHARFIPALESIILGVGRLVFANLTVPAAVHAALQAPALTTAPGVVDATEAHIAVLLPQLRLIVGQRTACGKRTEALLQELATQESPDGEQKKHRDVQILRSLPGVGRQVAATMLAEASRPLRARDYHKLRLYVGIAPVTAWSGKRRLRPRVRMRRACNRRLRQAAYHWGRVSLLYDGPSRA